MCPHHDVDRAVCKAVQNLFLIGWCAEAAERLAKRSDGGAIDPVQAAAMAV